MVERRVAGLMVACQLVGSGLWQHGLCHCGCVAVWQRGGVAGD